MDGARAQARVVHQVELGPRVPGTPGHAAMMAWLEGELMRLGAGVEPQAFTDSTLGRALPLTRDGLGRHVAATRAAAGMFAGGLGAHDSVALVVEPELDIVCSFPRLPAASAISATDERAFDALAGDGWHVAKLRVDTAWLRRRHPWIEADAPTVTVLRSCLLKREHIDVAAELAGATADALTAERA